MISEKTNKRNYDNHMNKDGTNTKNLMDIYLGDKKK